MNENVIGGRIWGLQNGYDSGSKWLEKNVDYFIASEIERETTEIGYDGNNRKLQLWKIKKSD